MSVFSRYLSVLGDIAANCKAFALVVLSVPECHALATKGFIRSKQVKKNACICTRPFIYEHNHKGQQIHACCSKHRSGPTLYYRSEQCKSRGFCAITCS